MQHLQLNEISVSSHGVREGALLAYKRYGQHWLERSIASHQSGGHLRWMRILIIRKKYSSNHLLSLEENLNKYAKKFLKWPDDIRKQEDIEAVHKMRGLLVACVLR